MINGGIIGTLLDCHCNWTAAWVLKHQNPTLANTDEMPCTVTAEYTIKLKRPTPAGVPLELRARAEPHKEQALDNKADRVWIIGELVANGVVTATCRGLFVAVKEGHPAYHRWG
jgi:hypothetical protein